jgi:hypothetical protein
MMYYLGKHDCVSEKYYIFWNTYIMIYKMYNEICRSQILDKLESCIKEVPIYEYNISVISWRSVLLMEEYWVSGEQLTSCKSLTKFIA